MRYDILGDSFSSYLKVFLEEGEILYALPESFVSMSGEAEISLTGQGVFDAIKRKISGSESLFLVKYRGKGSGVEIILSPSTYGKVIPVTVRAKPLIIQDRCYLAHTSNVRITTEFVGAKGVLTSSGFLWLKAEPAGDEDGIVFVISSGEVEEVELDSGKSILLDPKHIVCYQSYLNVNIGRFGNLGALAFGKEGLIFKVSGNGKIWIQMRKPPEENNKIQRGK